MMHQPSGGIGGTASDIKIQAEQMLHIKKQMAELIAEHTGQTLDQIERDSDRDRWFTAEEAKEYGFVDQVVQPGRRRRGAVSAGDAPVTRRPRVTERADMTMNPFSSPARARRRCPCLRPSSRYILPQFEERTSYGMKRLDPYTKLFEDRIIFLGVQVDDASADDIIAQLIVLESQDPDRDILMYINSPGGSFTAMTAIYDTMQYIRPDVQTFVVGQAASAAAVLLGRRRQGQAVRPAERPDPHPPARARGRRLRPGVRHRDPGQRGAPHAHLARGDAGRALRPHPGAGQRKTSSATRSCRPRRPRSTASSTRCCLPQGLARQLTIARSRSDDARPERRALRWSGIAVQPPCR